MTNARDIKRRIKSIASTQQITKAMKMVSASKLKKAQSGVLAVRPYCQKVREVIGHLSQSSTNHPYLQKREVKKVAYVIIGSDRGLCGGFSGNLLRFSETVLRDCPYPYAIIPIGVKIRDYFQHQNAEMPLEYISISDNPDYMAGREIGNTISQLYLDGTFDEIHLIFTKFKTALTQNPISIQLLPVPHIEDESSQLADYIFEPSKEAILDVVLPQYIEVSLYQALLEAKASEHGARMTAMSSATDNACDMIDKLTLSLNRARQAAITTEISEIVGGAAALS